MRTEKISLRPGALERAYETARESFQATMRSTPTSSMPSTSMLLARCPPRRIRPPNSRTIRLQPRRCAPAVPAALPSLSALFDSVAGCGGLAKSAPLPLLFLDDAAASFAAASAALSAFLSDPALRAALGAVASVAAVVVAVGKLLEAGALPRATGDVLARVSFALLLPCLQFVSVGTTLARMKLSGAGVGTVLVLPLAAAAHVGVGLFLG